MPVFIVAAYDENGVPNAMNAAWGGIYTDNEVGICLSEGHKTTQNILATKAFTVSMGTAEFVTACGLERKPIIALLAGSRVAEIKNNLPLMIEAAEAYPDYQLVVAGAPGIPPQLYAPYLQGHRVKVVEGKTYRLLQQSRAALVTSGTATLETALLRVPQVVCYWVGGGKLFYKTFEKILRVPYVSLVNLIADAPVVCELLGYRATVENLRRELACLFDEENRERMLAGYDRVARRLGSPGAPEQAARSMVSALRG